MSFRIFVWGVGRGVWGVVVLVLLGCQTAVFSPPPPSATPAPLKMLQYNNEAAFDLLYPEGWTYYLPRPGMLLFGEEKTINQAQPGAMMTILRVEPSAVHGNAEGELNHFLDFGPKRDGYALDGERKAVEINGRSALVQHLRFPGEGENIPMTATVVVAETSGGAVYIFASTAPTDVWEANAAKFDVMVSSVSFHE